MTTKQFYFGVEKKHGKNYVTNDDYGVCLISEAEANMVCNMINGMVKEVNIGASKLENEIEQLNKSRDELIDENRHIKSTIQTMLIDERTAIGKSVLKQLWERIME